MTHWYDKEEQYLGRLEKQCNSYANYFNKDYQYYHKLSSRFNIPILIISSINALCAISLNDFLSQRYVSILNAILSAGTGVLGSIQLYMKINEKMANALRSSILMKRLALKVSKELSVDREQRMTEGGAFLQDCFSEFNAALEQSNPIEKKIQNFLALGEEAPPQRYGFMNFNPKIDEQSLRGRLRRLEEPRARTLWGLIAEARTASDSPQGSSSPPDPISSSPGGESPSGSVEEP